MTIRESHRQFRRSRAERVLTYLHVATYSLAAVLALSLLVVGTVALIAEVKGTWHWMIHLESTISYMAVFIGLVLVVLVPLAGVTVVGRWIVHG